jgi:hypothetical protein
LMTNNFFIILSLNIIKYIKFIYNMDFDINNYTKSELISFFKLNDSYTNEELEKNEEKLKNRILNSNYDSKYKYEILIFILEAKDKLKIKNKKKETEQQNNVGKIINQNHDYPIIQKPSIMKNNVNSYGTYLIKTNYIFDTRYRDDFFRTVPTDSTFSLPITLNNVISITLSTIQFPNTFFNFNKLYKTNELYIYEEITNNEGIVILPEGNYNFLNFPEQLEKAINEQIVGTYIPGGPNRFNVSISEFTHRTTISNSSYNFRMNIIKKTSDDHSTCSIFSHKTHVTPFDDKKGIESNTYFKSMGYQMGYRQIDDYLGKNSYTSESQYDGIINEVVYFTMDEFRSESVCTNTYGILPNSLVDHHILAVIPVTTPSFTVTWDTMANFIYKTRKYFAPIDIYKIRISIITRTGNIIDLNDNNFAFVLEVETIHDNIKYVDKNA